MATQGPVKVYILAGQSNMQGHAALRTLEYLSGKHRLERIINNILDNHQSPQIPYHLALQDLGINFEYDPESLSRIPSTGPMLFIANHPYGIADGMIVQHVANLTRGNYI